MELIIPKPELEIHIKGARLLIDPIEAEWTITEFMKKHKDIEDLVDRDKAICTELQAWLNCLDGMENIPPWTAGETFAFLLQLPEKIEEYKKKLSSSPNSSTPTDTPSSLTPLQSPLDAFNSPGSSETKSQESEKPASEPSDQTSPQTA